MQVNLEKFGWDDFYEKNFSEYREKGFLPARVSKEHTHIYFLYSEIGEMTAKVAGKIRHTSDSKCDYPAIGDWVVAQPHIEKEFATIHSVLPRKSCFSRKTPGSNTQEQVIAANIDVAFIVTGLDNNFNPRRIERYLARLHNSGAQPVIVLNKKDLCANLEEKIGEIKKIAGNVPVVAACALDPEGVRPLRKFIEKGRTAALFGSSGVGKSQIINSLIGAERQVVQGVRNDSKGRHTTTNRELILLPCGGLIIDTPGIREIQVWCDIHSLNKAFDDIFQLAANCKFSDCGHQAEPGCAIKSAIENGTLDAARLNSYLKMKNEIIELEKKQSIRKKIKEKANWKKVKYESDINKCFGKKRMR